MTEEPKDLYDNIRTANNIKQVQSESDIANAYLQTIPIQLDKQDIVDAETEWVEIQIKKEKLLAYAKAKILTPDDTQKISGKAFIKKSGVRRLMNAFGISIPKIEILSILDRDWETAPEDYVKQFGSKKELIIIVQATAEKKITISKNGQTYSWIGQEMRATASFSSREAYEKHQPYKFHNILATAETRAKSRSALDMLSGDVSLEEITFDEDAKADIKDNTKYNYQEG